MKEINEYLNLNHLIESKMIINNEKRKIHQFEDRYFKEHLLTREEVLNYLSDEDLNTFTVYGLHIKEYLDLAEKDKFIGHKKLEIPDGKGLYIINRNEKTIHTYRFPSADPLIYDGIKSSFLGDDYLIFTHTRTYNTTNTYQHNYISKIEQYSIKHRKLCTARRLAAMFYARKDLNGRLKPDMVGTVMNIQREYWFDIEKNKFHQAYLWQKHNRY